MTPIEDKLIDEKFNSIKELMISEFKIVSQELRHIKEQTTKTNGRVNDLEKQAKNCIPLSNLKKKVEVLSLHPLNCEVSKDHEKRIISVEKFQWRAIGIYLGVSTVAGILTALITLYFHTIQ